MPTPEIRRLLTQEEQRRIEEERKRTEAQLLAEQQQIAEHASAERRKIEEREENLGMFRQSGILDGLKRIEAGLKEQNQPRVQLVASERGTQLVLVWGSHYKVDTFSDWYRDSISIWSEHNRFIFWEYANKDYSAMSFELDRGSDKKVSGIKCTDNWSSFEIIDWGDPDKVNEFLAHAYLRRKIEKDTYRVGTRRYGSYTPEQPQG